MRKSVFIVSLALCLAGLGPAGADEGTAEEHQRPLTEADAAAGKPLYLRECSGCHGERGNGAGPAADFVDPRPRDFTQARFKFRTTRSGQPPATNDILRTIQRGIPGSAMPSFSFLTEDERKKIAAYVLKLADLLDSPEPEALDTGTPPPATAESLPKGKDLFADAGCTTCHGDAGKGDGKSAKDLKDTTGRPIKPRDLTQGVFRGGGERADIYYRLMTGLDGTPMPSYRDSIDPPELWEIVDYVLSLKQPQAAKPRPADPIEAGREVAAKYSCRGCHVLDDGIGGSVGPDLRLSAQKLYPDWVRTFLKAPREYGKIYPWRVWRMPDLRLSDEEVDVMAKYLAAVGKRHDAPAVLPEVASFATDKLDQGKLYFVLRCAECHTLGSTIVTPLAKQQGPDLSRVAGRVDYEWAKKWITNPKLIDPNTRMLIPDLTPEQVDMVRMFVWKTSVESNHKLAAAQQSQTAQSK